MALRRSLPVASRLFSTRGGPEVTSFSETKRTVVTGSEVKSSPSQSVQSRDSDSVSELFSSVPLAGLATYLGETFAPKLEEISAVERQKQRRKKYTQFHEPPQIPHILPLTRWAAQSEEIRETLVVNESEPRRVRLSWYHPDDTMVPREWFLKGLLEDLKFYRPFSKKK